MNKLEMVKEWRRTFGLPVSDVPMMPDQGLHSKLIADEAQEIYEASTHIDIRDVIADLHYFIIGLASEAGVTKEQLDADFASVHAANMAKLWTKAQVLEKFNPPFDWLDKTYTLHFDDSTGMWAVSPTCDGSSYIVRLNGKVQKPPGWVPAVLEGGAV